MATTLPRNADVAAQFELLADILEIEGYDAFRVLAYRRAAALIRDTGGSIAQLALDGKAKQLQGIGKTIEGKIVEIVEDGEVHALTKHKAIVPPDVVAFMRLPGLGPKTARRIWKDLGVTTIPELRKAAEAEQLRTLSGLGPKLEEGVLKALDEKKPAAPEEDRPLLGTALPAVLDAVESLRAHPAAVKVSEAGSARRRRETVRDLDIIATATDAEALIAHFVELPWVVEVVARGGTKATVLSEQGLRFDLRVVPPECYGNLLQHFTGSKHHNVALREEAVRKGFSVSEYGVKVVETDEVITHEDEEALYELLGYQFIPPELRENLGELEAARAGTLPQLVELGDLKGDLHAHTTWSADGRASSEEMALAAKERGYRYLAVTDHSHYLREGRMEAQDRELDALNERLAPFRLLKGVEANIKADGTIDVDDETLGDARVGDRVAAHELRQEPDRARARRDGEPARRLHRPSDRAQDRQALGRCARHRARGREGARDAAPCSRSTRSPTGWTCPTSSRGSPARRACPSPSRATRTGSRRSPTSRSASGRRVGPG